jgi:cation transporter-like permease
MIYLILATGILVGTLPGILKLDKIFSVTNIIVGFVGALVGAFLGFGGAPFLLKHSFLHEKTLMVAVSFLFVFLKVFITRARIIP